MKKVLIIEDNNSLRSSLYNYLTSKNFEVIAASDSFIGIQLANQFKPDLIICEANMPRINGFTLSKTLKTYRVTANIPIFLLVEAECLNYCQLQVPASKCIQKNQIFSVLDNLIKPGIAAYS